MLQVEERKQSRNRKYLWINECVAKDCACHAAVDANILEWTGAAVICLLSLGKVICGELGSVFSDPEMQGFMCSVPEYRPCALLHCLGFLKRMSSSCLFYGKNLNASFRAQLSA